MKTDPNGLLAIMDYDRRTSDRIDVRFAADIVVADIRLRDCVVKNLSKTGAKLIVPVSTWVPETFELHCQKGSFKIPAAKVWEKAGEIGIRFI